MKKLHLIGILIINLVILSSCDKEEVSTDIGDLKESWFRSYKNKVSGGPNEPSFFRGESHINLTFSENGEFIKKRTTLGLYEGTSLEDTTSIVIESGTYTVQNDSIKIILDRRIWWDSFYEDMEDFEDSNYDPNKYMDMTFKVIEDELKLEYFIVTDVVSEDQEKPGVDKFEESYTKK